MSSTNHSRNGGFLPNRNEITSYSAIESMECDIVICTWSETMKSKKESRQKADSYHGHERILEPFNDLTR